jgi:hypothetical protein
MSGGAVSVFGRGMFFPLSACLRGSRLGFFGGLELPVFTRSAQQERDPEKTWMSVFSIAAATARDLDKSKSFEFAQCACDLVFADTIFLKLL